MTATGGGGKDNDLSQAVILFTGRGHARSPRASREAVLAAFGDERGQRLADQVAALFAEANTIPVDWGGLSLGQAGDVVRARIAAKHPDLTPAALDALRWKWTFDSR